MDAVWQVVGLVGTSAWDAVVRFFLNGFCVNLVRPLVVLVPLLIIFRKAGLALGLPQLFRRRSWYDRFFIGMGVGVLLWQAVLAGYLFEGFATNYTFDRPPFCEHRTVTDSPDGTRGRYLVGDVLSVLAYAAHLLVGAGVCGLAGWLGFALVRRAVDAIELRRNPMPVPPPAAKSEAEKAAEARHDPQRLPGVAPVITGMLVGFVFMAAVAWALLPGGGPRAEGAKEAEEWRERNLGGGREVMRASGEWAVEMAGYGRAAGRDATWEEYAKPPHDAAAATEAGRQTTDKTRDGYKPFYPVYGLFFLGGLIAFLVFVCLAADPWYRLLKLGRPTFSPVAGLVFLLHLALLVQTVADYFSPAPQLIYVLLVALTVVFARKYKLRHPNISTVPKPADPAAPPQPEPLVDLATHYRNVQRHYHEWQAEKVKVMKGEPVPEQPAPPPGTKRLLRNGDLKTWDANNKKPLLLLCVSGGGSRAAAWTMKVLTELERRIEAKNGCKWSLPYHIRVVTGASGGILGASYYVSTLDAPDANARPPASRYGKTGLLAELNKTIRGDFLTYIVHTMLTRDLPGLFLPRFLPPLAGYDRGHAFEWAMEKMLKGGLTQTFDTLMKDEAAGWRPSLVFSPMMVEDGRQLLVSNLDLLDVIHNTGKGLDPAQPEELLSREAVEFFRLFPHATDFRIGTAARMSGSFPYVLPAVPLPTHPRRRVVDAGYFDNYGVGVAASWLFNNLDWVGRVANKVAIVQVRDGLSVDERLMTRPTDPPPSTGELAAEWLTTPPAGLYQARVSSNMLRNDNLLHLLHDRMAQRFKGTLPFVTPAFELPAGGDVSLSYTLTEAEQRLIDDCLPGDDRRPDDAKLKQEVDQLEARVNAFVEWFAA